MYLSRLLTARAGDTASSDKQETFVVRPIMFNCRHDDKLTFQMEFQFPTHLQNANLSDLRNVVLLPNFL